MSGAVLGQLTLGYQLVWNRSREPAAVLLFIDRPIPVAVEAPQLLVALARDWSAQSPKMILCVQPLALLLGLLQNATPNGPWIAVQDAQLDEPTLAEGVRDAHARGLTLVWRGAAPRAPAEFSAMFALAVVAHGPSMHASADQIVEAVPTLSMAQHYLDQQGVLGVAGWPLQDQLQERGRRKIEPGKRGIDKLIEETDADAPLDVIEQTLAEEPMLCFRFLVHMNSAARGLRGEVESLRHGLMLLGLSNFKRWLLEQLPMASSEPDLQPVKAAVVVRARLTAQLLDTGEDDALRSELYLCGLLSQIDLLMGEPLDELLQRIPLSARVTAAIRSKSGPYSPYLELAAALEYPHMRSAAALCAAHEIDTDEVNRALLRVLAYPQYQPPQSRFQR